MTAREAKGLQIAATTKLRKQGQNWIVPSQSSSKQYEVSMDKTPRCNCPDFEFRNQPCKHIIAVQYTIQREVHADGSETVSETVKVTYTQDWPAYNAAQTNEKAHFMTLLHELCKDIQEPEQTNGRPRNSLRDMIFSSTFKVYSTISARRFMTDLAEAQEKGYIAKTPHYCAMTRCLEQESLMPVLHSLIEKSSLPLKSIETGFAVDSSGFSTSKLSNYYDTKYAGRGNIKHAWVKTHLMCGVKTNVVTAVEIGQQHDSFMFPRLVESTSKNFEIKKVAADKGYSSKRNLEVVDAKGAVPFIPFKINTVLRNDGDLWSKMYHYFAFNREDFLSHYHMRSNVESTFASIKAKFGGYVRSRNQVAQANEVLAKIVCHNICCLISAMYELGLDVQLN
jgi:transposase